MKAVQKFSKKYLDESRQLKPEEIVSFVENFRLLMSQSRREKSRLISIKIPESLLANFKIKANLKGVPYQTQIKKLMLQWLSGKPVI